MSEIATSVKEIPTISYYAHIIGRNMILLQNSALGFKNM
jgi:hypothetical protein